MHRPRLAHQGNRLLGNPPLRHNNPPVFQLNNRPAPRLQVHRVFRPPALQVNHQRAPQGRLRPPRLPEQPSLPL
jgi:hypothetical protein